LQIATGYYEQRNMITGSNLFLLLNHRVQFGLLLCQFIHIKK